MFTFMRLSDENPILLETTSKETSRKMDGRKKKKNGLPRSEDGGRTLEEVSQRMSYVGMEK
jgi:hypothetical protein